MTFKSNDRSKESLSVRINCSNRLHHIWNNNGMWWIHYTLHQGPTKKRARASLGTKSVEEAILKRDQRLAQVAMNLGSGGGDHDPKGPMAIAA